ncbi:sigma-70 family RNA polymerase sigma factor [bacterium]|nr:sigma-70 family RNA polymerase sigma factor [bacterium]MCB2179201.1 sigma-70 family RNA polymerase sigma factor [bacterium]
MKPHQEVITDQSLIEKATKGDQEAFGDLYERYLEPIYRYIYYRVPTPEEAEDLTETIFLRAWETLMTKKNVKIDNFRAWIYRIAHNLTIDYHRKRKPIQFESGEIDFPDNTATTDPELEVEQKLSSQSLHQAISKLEENFQNVIILRFFNKLSHAETAEIMGIQEGNVRVIQYRALKKLQTLLSEDYYE